MDHDRQRVAKSPWRMCVGLPLVSRRRRRHCEPPTPRHRVLCFDLTHPIRPLGCASDDRRSMGTREARHEVRQQQAGGRRHLGFRRITVRAIACDCIEVRPYPDPTRYRVCPSVDQGLKHEEVCLRHSDMFGKLLGSVRQTPAGNHLKSATGREYNGQEHVVATRHGQG